MKTYQKTPAALGFRMPAEWERHDATWLAWPHNLVDWPGGKIEVVRWTYGEMVRKIAARETVRLLVNSKTHASRARQIFDKAGVDLRRVEVVPFPTNRGWMRDCGPIFVRRRAQKKREAAIVHFHFNAWARYPDWERDYPVPSRAARRLGCPLFHARAGGRGFVLEGGSVDVNGRGTVLTTEECLLDPQTQVRNPGLGREEVEGALKNYLGVTQVLWLGKGIAGDDTHGHVDDLCRFVDARTVVVAQEKNRRDVNYKPLAENRERLKGMRLEDGSRLRVVEVPMPGPVFWGGRRLPASYANFYVCNAAVLVPTFNDPNDRAALGILSELFKDRPVVGIHSVDLVLGGGSLHCLSQQQPVGA